MTVELEVRVLTIFLGIANIVAVSHLATWQRGYRWTASSREEAVPPLSGLAGRLQWSLANFLETFPFSWPLPPLRPIRTTASRSSEPACISGAGCLFFVRGQPAVACNPWSGMFQRSESS
jgi:hypothetical protein